MLDDAPGSLAARRRRSRQMSDWHMQAQDPATPHHAAPPLHSLSIISFYTVHALVVRPAVHRWAYPQLASVCCTRLLQTPFAYSEDSRGQIAVWLAHLPRLRKPSSDSSVVRHYLYQGMAPWTVPGYIVSDRSFDFVTFVGNLRVRNPHPYTVVEGKLVSRCKRYAGSINEVDSVQARIGCVSRF